MGIGREESEWWGREQWGEDEQSLDTLELRCHFKTHHLGWKHGSAVEHSPSIHEAQESTPSTHIYK